MPSDLEPRYQLCRVARDAAQRGFICANEGNLSIRLDADTLLCTPTRVCKADIRPGDICRVDRAGQVLSGTQRPTSELRLHLALYHASPEIGAVVHTHPPVATAFATARRPLPSGILPEVEVFVGPVPLIDYETPGTQAFADLLRPHATSARAALLANHGLVTWDRSLQGAWWWTQIIEKYCRIVWLAEALGGAVPLEAAHLAQLAAIRDNLDRSGI